MPVFWDIWFTANDGGVWSARSLSGVGISPATIQLQATSENEVNVPHAWPPSNYSFCGKNEDSLPTDGSWPDGQMRAGG